MCCTAKRHHSGEYPVLHFIVELRLQRIVKRFWEPLTMFHP